MARNFRKSPADSGNIPLLPETFFDPHWKVGAAGGSALGSQREAALEGAVRAKDAKVRADAAARGALCDGCESRQIHQERSAEFWLAAISVVCS
jgi:hypothetical protein